MLKYKYLNLYWELKSQILGPLKDDNMEQNTIKHNIT